MATKKKYYRLFKNTAKDNDLIPVRIKYFPNDMVTDYDDCLDELVFLNTNGNASKSMVFWIKETKKSEYDKLRKVSEEKMGIYIEPDAIFYSDVESDSDDIF